MVYSSLCIDCKEDFKFYIIEIGGLCQVFLVFLCFDQICIGIDFKIYNL